MECTPATMILCYSTRPIQRGTGAINNNQSGDQVYQSKLHKQHVICTVSHWGNIMFMDESRLALQTDNPHVKVWREKR